MTANRDTLAQLFDSGQIDLRRGSLFSQVPAPLPPDRWERIEGMMLGLAIGDALGNTTEGLLPHERRALFGEITDYVGRSDAPPGAPSDDTQLAFWTLEQINRDRAFAPERVASRFAQERIYGIGHTMREFLRNYKAGAPWYQCGPKSAGNGALMRIAPMLIPHLKSPSADLWVDAALAAMITHNDAASISVCLAFVHMLWQLLQMDRAPEPEWWVKTYMTTVQDSEGDTSYRPRWGANQEYRGPCCEYAAQMIGEAWRRGMSVREAGNLWGSGAYLLETLPSVLYILMRHANDPEQAIIRAVNDTKDNDTIAAIVGAAVGALYGKSALPERWLSGLLGRTSASDDGRVFELLSQARPIWAY